MPNENAQRNEPCWCGSGKKYKHCHLRREEQEPLPFEQYRTAREAAFTKKYCLHPEADLKVCKGGIIRAHSITKNGGLSRIADEGHVYSCVLHSRAPWIQQDVVKKPNKVGIRLASTFTGFCHIHDSSTFAPLEKYSFVGNNEQVFLLGYRAIVHELFLKRGDLALTPVQQELDRGRARDVQRRYQGDLAAFKSGVAKAEDELASLKSLHDSALLNKDYSQLRSYIVFFQETPDILCNAVTQPDIDFSGNKLQILGNLQRKAEWLHFSLIATDNGGAAVFSWLGDNGVSERFIRSLHSFNDQTIPHAIVRFAFEFFENTYFSPKWWDNLHPQIQATLMDRQFRHFVHSTDCLQDDRIRAVRWTVTSRVTQGWEI